MGTGKCSHANRAERRLTNRYKLAFHAYEPNQPKIKERMNWQFVYKFKTEDLFCAKHPTSCAEAPVARVGSERISWNSANKIIAPDRDE